MSLSRSLEDYGIGRTALIEARGFCPSGRLLIKLESGNFGGSIKSRTAYFILQDLASRRRGLEGLTLIESTSGNLGISLATIARDEGAAVICAVDRTVAREKLKQIERAGGEVHVVDADEDGDFRAARVRYVARVAAERGYVMPDQYSNVAGMRAHEQTTGPEIWAATNGKVDIVVGAVGTGGTICGVGRFLKSTGRKVSIVGVEPLGSTIFGGEPGPYMSAGSGLNGPSALVREYGSVIDRFAKIPDALAIAACNEFAEKEPFGVGITGAAAALVARHLAARHPDALLVSIAADGVQNYASDLASAKKAADCSASVAVCDTEWKRAVEPHDR